MMEGNAAIDAVVDEWIRAGLDVQPGCSRMEIYADIYRAHALGVSLIGVPVEWPQKGDANGRTR